MLDVVAMDKKFSFIGLVAQAYVIGTLLAGPFAYQYMGAPQFLVLSPFILMGLYAWWVWHGSLIGAVLVDLFWLPLLLVLWPFHPARETEFFSAVKWHFRLKRMDAEKGAEQDRAQNDFSRRLEGFVVGVLASIVATLLMPYVESMKTLLRWLP
jgi:hypothetical protein